MALVNNLSEYVSHNHDQLFSKAVVASKTQSLVNVATGIKFKESLPVLTTAVNFADGSTCGFSSTSTQTVSERIIEVAPIKINQSWCDKVMNKSFANYKIKTAANQNVVPFEEYFIADLNAGISAEVEKIVWQGKKIASPAKNTDYANGFLETAKTGSIAATPTKEGALEAVKAAYAKIPAEVLPKAVIFVGQDTFRDMALELTAANMFNYVTDVTEAMEIVLPGTTTKVYGVGGLNGTSKVVAADPANLFWGTDMESDEETYDVWYSKDSGETRFAVEFKIGTQVAFPSEIVIATIKTA